MVPPSGHPGVSGQYCHLKPVQGCPGECPWEEVTRMGILLPPWDNILSLLSGHQDALVSNLFEISFKHSSPFVF